MSRLREAIFSLVRRPGAEDLLLLTLLAFALSVTLTRLFLGLAGYPQLGGGTLHIAHVLWGGLFLFVAALLPLIFANQSVYRLTAILSGIGVGLFIDEVGKFITQNNDYFYPPAAPIIYAFFLVCVLVFLQVSRPRRRQARLELYAALEYLEQVLERDLDPTERRLLTGHLEAAAGQSDEPELARLASELLDFVHSDKISVVNPSPNRLENLRTKIYTWQSRTFAKPNALLGVIAGLGALGLTCAAAAVLIITTNLHPGRIGVTLLSRSGAGFAYTYWVMILAFFLVFTGLGILTGALLLWKNRAQTTVNPLSAFPEGHRLASGLRWSYAALVLQLTVLDLLIFYYFQFGTIVLVAVQFTLLLAVIYYRKAV